MDVHCYLGESAEGRYDIAPYTPGHEVGGKVVAIGADVTTFAVGDKVTAECVFACGHCANCKEGLMPSACLNFREKLPAVMQHYRQFLMWRGIVAALRKTLVMIVKLCLLFGIFITAASLLAAKPLLLLKTDPTIISSSQTYLYVQFSGTLVIIAYNMASAVLRCLGDSRTPLLAIVIASVANIVLDLLFVLVFHWGIFGAAVATVIAQFFPCIIDFS